MELEILQNGKKIDTIDFGTPEVGSKNQVTIQLHNKSMDWPIENIKCVVTEKDVIIDYPHRLNPNEYSNVTIYWNPEFERRTPLNITESFTGVLVIG